jgi:hypothetical protein
MTPLAAPSHGQIMKRPPILMTCGPSGWNQMAARQNQKPRIQTAHNKPEKCASWQRLTCVQRNRSREAKGQFFVSQCSYTPHVSVWAWHIDLIARFADHRGHGELDDDDLHGGGGPMGPLGAHDHRCKIDSAVDQAHWPGLVLSQRCAIDEAATPGFGYSAGSAAGSAHP